MQQDLPVQRRAQAHTEAFQFTESVIIMNAFSVFWANLKIPQMRKQKLQTAIFQIINNKKFSNFQYKLHFIARGSKLHRKFTQDNDNDNEIKLQEAKP